MKCTYVSSLLQKLTENDQARFEAARQKFPNCNRRASTDKLKPKYKGKVCNKETTLQEAYTTNQRRQTARGTQNSRTKSTSSARAQKWSERRNERAGSVEHGAKSAAFISNSYLRDHPVPTASDLSPALSPRLCA